MIDPSVHRALDELFSEQSLSRRRFLGRAGSSALALSALSTVIAACGGVEGESQNNDGDGAKQAEAVSHPKTAIGTWVFSNWPYYIDKSVVPGFDRKYGANTRYVEDINDNFEFYGKVRQQLTRGESIKRDIVVLTDYMAARWVRNGFVEPIDKGNVPNARNLVDNLKSINYDPKRNYTLPWQSGAIGIGYDPKRVGRELKSIKDFFDPRFKGRVTLLSEPYDSAGMVMLMQGVDASKANMGQILEAINYIDQQNSDGQIRRFTGNDYTTDLIKGNALVAMAYSGDVVQLRASNPNFTFVYPEEGSMLFTDNMMMPKHLAHPYAAETFMNYVYDPKVAVKLAKGISYVSPVDGIAELAPEIADDPLIVPPPDIRKRLHPYPALSPADERRMQEAMAKVVGA